MKKLEQKLEELKNLEDEDLKCSICNYYFSQNLKPYLLNCNHNLCIKCINGIIEKNMFNCPICRRIFSLEEKNDFKINENFLELVNKILQFKLIYCNKCQKIFTFLEHYENCDQINFLDSNYSFENVNNLAKDCLKILQNSNKHLNILNNSEKSIYEEINRIIKIILINFYEHFSKTIQQFYDGIPILNYEELIEEIFNFLKKYDGFVKTYLNLEEEKNINYQNLVYDQNEDFDFIIKMQFNKFPKLKKENNELKILFNNKNNNENTDDENKKKGNIFDEILKYNFSDFKNFKELKDFKKNFSNLDLDFIDSENDSECDFNKLNNILNIKDNSKFIQKNTKCYKNDIIEEMNLLFSKNKQISREENKINIDLNQKVKIILYF